MKKQAKLTRGGVMWDLNLSPFRMDVPYKQRTLTFVFSSETNRKKFYDRFIENREKINESLSNRFKLNITVDVMCDVRLYETIEKRGFLIVTEEGKKIWQKEDMVFGGVMMTSKNSTAL